MATMKLFRCHRPSCKATPKEGMFCSDTPICPTCKLEASHPKFGHMIQRLVMIHFDPPSDFPGVGMGYRACDHEKEIQVADVGGGMPPPWHAGTASPAVVNCPACQLTAEYKAAFETTQREDGPDMTSAALERFNTVQRVG